jgi:hypothetical protein
VKHECYYFVSSIYQYCGYSNEAIIRATLTEDGILSAVVRRRRISQMADVTPKSK